MEQTTNAEHGDEQRATPAARPGRTGGRMRGAPKAQAAREAAPSQNRPNGDRDAGGRFAPGNAGGPGNPDARRTNQLRSALLEVLTDDDIRAVVKALVDKAKTGDLNAIREVLDRSVGKSASLLDLRAAERGDDDRPSPPDPMTPLWERPAAEIREALDAAGIEYPEGDDALREFAMMICPE